MKNITEEEIQKATVRYAKALTADLLVKRKLEKNEVEKRKTHHEVVMAFSDLQALRFHN